MASDSRSAAQTYADKLIERYERLLSDDYWPDSQDKARRAVRVLVNCLKQECEVHE